MTEAIEQLLERGLELFGRGDVEPAVACWRDVLRLVPGHAAALDYLGALDQRPSEAPTSRRAPVIDRRLLNAHLAERRYEEAWDLLQEALALYPNEAELLKALEMLEPHVALRLAARARLSSIPRALAGDGDVGRHGLSSEHESILRITRDSRNVAAVLDRSPQCRVGTLRALRDLTNLGLITLETRSGPATSRGPDFSSATRAALERVDGFEQAELHVSFQGLVSNPDDAGGGFAELAEALRFVDPDDTLEEMVGLRDDEIHVLRPLATGAIARVRLDAERSTLALARLQVTVACAEIEEDA